MVRKLPVTLFLFLLAATVSVAAEIKATYALRRTRPHILSHRRFISSQLEAAQLTHESSVGPVEWT